MINCFCFFSWTQFHTKKGSRSSLALNLVALQTYSRIIPQDFNGVSVVLRILSEGTSLVGSDKRNFRNAEMKFGEVTFSVRYDFSKVLFAVWICLPKNDRQHKMTMHIVLSWMHSNALGLLQVHALKVLTMITNYTKSEEKRWHFFLKVLKCFENFLDFWEF